MTGRYLIADKCIEIRSLYRDVHRYCERYRTEREPDFTVVIGESDLAFERGRGAETPDEPRENRDPYLERLAVYRKIAEKMPAYGTFLFHGSCVAVDGEGYLFTAKSGTGKSTHAGFWRKLLGERAVMVNDDKPLLHVDESGVTVYGTPWNGKHRLGENLAVPLRALCLLERAQENRIRPIPAAEAWPMLLQQSYRPLDGAAMKKTMELLGLMAAQVPIYRLGCNLDPDAARVAYEAMKG